MSAEQVAQKCHLNQTKISRFELGKVIPDKAALDALCKTLKVDIGTRRTLFEQLDLLLLIEKRNVEITRYNININKELCEIESVAQTICEVDCYVISGLLQTAEYTLATASLRCDEDVVREVLHDRQLRQRHLLDSTKQFTFIITENVLRRRYLRPDGMARQLQHLMTMSSLPNLEIAIVPDSNTVIDFDLNPVAVIYDDSYVWVDTQTFGFGTSNPVDIAGQQDLARRAHARALHDGDSYFMLTNLRDEYLAESRGIVDLRDTSSA